MIARTPSRERSLGREILSDPLLAEALAAFAATDRRTIPNATDFLLHRVLLEWKWLDWTPDGYVAGEHLLAFRQREEPDGVQ